MSGGPGGTLRRASEAERRFRARACAAWWRLRAQEQPHSEFTRKGDDLFIKRSISLTEALCGFEMELTHLDGRKLLIKTEPGEVIKPVAYDPLGEFDDATTWDLYEDCDTPSLEHAAVAETAAPRVNSVGRHVPWLCCAALQWAWCCAQRWRCERRVSAGAHTQHARRAWRERADAPHPG